MNKRPLSVTVIGTLFLVAGAVGLAYHATEFKPHGSFQFGLLLVCFVRFLAIFGAVFLLRAREWARWLLVVWLAYHVVLSALHSVSETIMHAALLAVIAWFLFRSKASAYFRAGRGKPDLAADVTRSV